MVNLGMVTVVLSTLLYSSSRVKYDMKQYNMSDNITHIGYQ